MLHAWKWTEVPASEIIEKGINAIVEYLAQHPDAPAHLAETYKVNTVAAGQKMEFSEIDVQGKGIDDGVWFSFPGYLPGEEVGDRLHDGDNRLITNSEGFSNLVAGCLKAAQEACAGTMRVIETVSD
jgi:hypothetical protein